MCPHRASCYAVSPGALTNVQKVIVGSLGGALDIAQRAPTKLGVLLTAVADVRQTFISATDLALMIAAVAVGAAAIVVLVLLHNRELA